MVAIFTTNIYFLSPEHIFKQHCNSCLVGDTCEVKLPAVMRINNVTPHK